MAETANIVSEQTVEVAVNGPNDITRMYIVTGIAEGSFRELAAGGAGFQSDTETFEAHVGPSLTASEFRRATATASLAQIEFRGGDASVASWGVTDVDADFDDDVGKVQLQYDLALTVTPGAAQASTRVSGVSFQVIILAAAAD
jgi:hypothetical protein